MPDTYIDYFEVDEYGGHFIEESKKLIGLDPIVNIVELSAYLAGVIEKVKRERKAAGLTKTTDSNTNAADKLRGNLSRFFNRLHSFDEEITVDISAFFQGGVLGNISQLKDSDVKAKTEKVLLGFEADRNKKFPDREDWLEKLTRGRDALDEEIKIKTAKRNEVATTTAALSSAREEFLTAYNGVAKPIIRGLLKKLGRSEEFNLFFKDMQVNEGPRAAKTATASADGNDGA